MARTTTTALLKTQASRQDAIQREQDKMVDRDWTLSDKSAEALSWYSSYYEERMNAAGDTSDKITFANKITTATRSSFSAQIQQKAIDVLEGRATTYDKYTSIIGLYNQAVENEDYDLALNLRQQADTAYNSYVAEQEAYAKAYGGGGSGGTGSADQADKDLVDTIKANMSDVISGSSAFSDNGVTLNDVSNILATVGEEGYVQLAREMGLDETASPAMLYSLVLDSQIQQIEESIGMVKDETKRAELAKTLYDMKFNKEYDFGGTKITADELKKAYVNEAAGNKMYDFVLSEGQYKPVKRDVEDVEVWRNPLTGELESNYKYGTSNMVKAQNGYANDEELLYYIDDTGAVQILDKNDPEDQKAFEQYNRNKGQGYAWQEQYGTKESNGKVVLTYNDILNSMGLRQGNDGNYEISPELQQRFSQLGFDDAMINESAINIDPRTGLPEFMTPEGKAFGFAYDATNDIFSPVEQRAMTPEQYLNGRQPTPSTSRILGNVDMLKDLQANVRGSVLQGADTAKLVQGQGIGSTTQVLQRAATAQQLNNLKLQEKLRVEALQNQAKLSVQPVMQPKLAPAQMVPTVRIVNPGQTWAGLQVQNRNVPKLTVTNTPATTQQAGTKLQGGTVLQGTTTSLQGGTGIQGGGIKVNTSGGTTGLRVR